MVNLEQYKQDKFVGTIDNVETMTLRKYLEDKERIESFKRGMTRFPKNLKTNKEIEDYKEARLDSDVLVLSYSVVVNDKVISNREFFGIPTITGWGRSKLKVVKEKNDNLPSKTEDWKNQQVKVIINKDGFLRLIE